MSPKVWFVTGASVGLGLAVTEHALKKGDSVLATCRKPEVISHLTKQYDSSKLVVAKVDVTKPDQIKAAFAEAQRAFGRIDVVYSNAGYGGVGEIEGFPEEHARGIFEVNFWGAANVSTEAIRFFREVNGPAVGGKLLQVASMVAYQGAPGLGYYTASKQAIQGLMESLAGEVVPAWNIKVHCIAPGGFETRGTKPESLVIPPVNPAYKESITMMVREYTPKYKFEGDTLKAARAIYEMGYTDDLPLHIALGDDSLGLLQKQIDAYTADHAKVKAASWSKDLKLDPAA